MIYITGDMHGDLERFKTPEIKKLKKDDILLVCGDFGFLWNGGKEEEKMLQWIGKRPFITAFIEGCHDNYDLLERYVPQDWNGGKARNITGNLFHLCRGGVFQLEGKTFFAFGGGDSEDHDERLQSNMWWSAEQPEEQEVRQAHEALSQVNYQVDYILTHDVPTRLKGFLNMEDNELSLIHAFLEIIGKNTEYKTWFFGKYHMDKVIAPCYHAVFREVIPVGELPGKKKK